MRGDVMDDIMHSCLAIADLSLKVVETKLVQAIIFSKDVIRELWLRCEWM